MIRALRLRRIARTTTIGAVSCLAAACLKSTDVQPSLLLLNGTWTYSGVQTAPLRETLSGTLTISGASGTSFQGQLVLVGVNAQNQSRSLNGSVSGTESGSNVIDFDANLDTQRRHVGQALADTVKGTWVSSSSDGTMSSGTFRIERESR